jgi:hypothetical protein
MPDVNEKVLAMVRGEIEKNPAVTNDVLIGKAAAIDRKVRKLNGRQFHGTYRLTAARSLAASGRTNARRKVGKKRASKGVVARSNAKARPVESAVESQHSDRPAVRAALLELASEIAKAKNNADIIVSLGSIDRYVERIVAAAGRDRS